MAQPVQRIINPGPLNDELLKQQRTHRSQAVLNGTRDAMLRVRRKFLTQEPVEIERVIYNLRRAGFYGVAQISFFKMDLQLITTLVERWRPETHTFHLPQGEMTITLQDVAVQLGLPIRGRVVTGPSSSNIDWQAYVFQMFGREPANTDFRGPNITLKWVAEYLAERNGNLEDDEAVEQYTRAYIFYLLGGTLLCDHSGYHIPLRYLLLLENLHDAGQYS